MFASNSEGEDTSVKFIFFRETLYPFSKRFTRNDATHSTAGVLSFLFQEYRNRNIDTKSFGHSYSKSLSFGEQNLG